MKQAEPRPTVICKDCDIRRVAFGKQRIALRRFRCGQCDKTYIETHENPLGEMTVPMEKAVIALKLLIEGTSIRATRNPGVVVCDFRALPLNLDDMNDWIEFDESDERTHPKSGSTIKAQFSNGRKAQVVFGGPGRGFSIINQSMHDPIVDTRILRWRYIDDENSSTHL